MDSPIVTSIFRQLFSHRSCRCLRSHSSLPFRTANADQHQRRSFASRKGEASAGSGGGWQQRMDAFPYDMSQQLKEYPQVTADDLRAESKRPKKVKMLTREFIEDSLYNPNYGYFSKHATIFNSKEPFDFTKIKNEPTFNKMVDNSYVEFEDALDEKEPDETRQLWHTPTELFRPYYGEAIARYLVTNYKLALFPYYDLIIYEMGAGNGTLMLNILDYLQETDPEVYQRTQFRIVEISSSLAELQRVKSKRHAGHIEIINRSIFDWISYVHSPCFFLALEVFDNFGHDAIRYDPQTEEPLQGNVLIDGRGEFFEYYERNIDPIAARFLRVRDAACRSTYTTPLGQSRFRRKLRYSLPFAPNLTVPEYIPTRLMQFFDVLHSYFPAHRLVVSDFHSLPETIEGYNAPVVQTRYQRRNVPVTTPFVQQGFFDIFFPTNFSVMEDMYRLITGKLTRVLTHEEFLRNWAYVEDTRTQSGENPMLSWYKNASVMTTI